MKKIADRFAELNHLHGSNSMFNIQALTLFIDELYFNMPDPHNCIHHQEIKSKSKEYVVRLPNTMFPLSSTPEDRKYVTLCGSTRAAHLEYISANALLTAMGFIVLNFGVDTHTAYGQFVLELTKRSEEDLNLLHFDKIIQADAVFILNPGDYIGKKTGEEITFAKSLGKDIWWLQEHYCCENCNCKVKL